MLSDFFKKLKEEGLKQKDIEERTGLTHGYISKLTRGAKPSLDTLILFSDKFHVSIDEILGRKIEERRKGDDHYQGEERRKASSRLARKEF